MKSYHNHPDTVIEALMLLNADKLRRLLPLAGVPKPLPTRKADMADAIARRLSGGRLRSAWGHLDKTQQLAVSEVLHGTGGAFHPGRFQSRYGKLPEGLKDPGYGKSSPLRLFLYPDSRHSGPPSVIPTELKERLLKFVPKPDAPTIATVDDIPETVRQPRRHYMPKGKEEFKTVPLVRRDMEQAAARATISPTIGEPTIWPFSAATTDCGTSVSIRSGPGAWASRTSTFPFRPNPLPP